MKKIILLVVLATLGMSMNSCSSDDSTKTVEEPIVELNPIGTISFKVNGVTKTFNTFIMTENETSLFITATIGSSIIDIVELEIQKDLIGTQALHEEAFTYTKNTIEYRFHNNYASLLTKNSNREIVGNFAGDLYSPGGEDLTITNGSINISY